MRRLVLLVTVGLGVGIGCGLLTPYPGSGDPAEVLGGSSPDGRSPVEGGSPQDPLFDPAIDDSVSVVSERDVIIANPGESFVIDLTFTAANRNVIGGGIQFPGSNEVQWTLIEGLEGESSGRITFAYAVPADICADVPLRCHEIVTQQFAVVRNLTGDVDGDGEQDGDFVVSRPATSVGADGETLEGVRIVLRCATCESDSCQELLEDAECASCSQPPECAQAYELCFAPGRPKEGTDEAEQFDQFFGVDGLAWKNGTTCAAGEDLCLDALDKALLECMDGDTDTDTGTGTAGGT